LPEHIPTFISTGITFSAPPQTMHENISDNLYVCKVAYGLHVSVCV